MSGSVRTGVVFAAVLSLLGSACQSSASLSPSASPHLTPTPGLPAAGTIAATVPGIGPMVHDGDYYGLAADSTTVWVYNGETGNLFEVSIASHTVVASLALAVGCAGGRGCGNLALSGASVWVANDKNGTVIRIDTRSRKLQATFNFGPQAGPQVYATPGAVWVAEYFGGTYSRIDPATNHITKQLDGHDGAETVLSASDALWFCDASTSALTRVDPASLKPVAQIGISAQGTDYLCFDTAATSGAVWVAAVSDSGGLFARVDTSTNQVTETALPPGRKGVERGFTSDGSHVWLIDSADGVYRLDPATGHADALDPIPGALSIASYSNAIWVATQAGTLLEITSAVG